MKFLKKFCKGLFFLALLFFLFWLIVIGFLRTQKGQSWAYQKALSFIEQQTDTQIEVGEVDFSFPHLALTHIKVSQNQQLLVTIHKIELSCAISNLLHGRIVIPSLKIVDIHLLQLPEEKEKARIESNSWKIQPLPFYFKFEQIDIEGMHIGQQVAQNISSPLLIQKNIKNSTFHLHGNVSNNPFKKSISAHLLLSAESENDIIPYLTVGIDTQNQQLSFSLHARDLPLELLDPTFASGVTVDLALYASASSPIWRQVLEQSFKNLADIQGHFRLFFHVPQNASSPLSSYFETGMKLRGQYTITPTNEIDFSSLSVEHPNFSLQGSGTIGSSLTIHQGKLTGSLKHVERLQDLIHQEMKGNIAFEADINGSLDSPHVLVRLESPDFSIAQQRFQQIHSSIEIQKQESQWKGWTQTQFDYRSIPWKVESAIDWNTTNVTFSDLSMDFLASHVQGRLIYRLPEFIWEGALQTQINLSEISPLLAIEVTGRAEGEILLLAAQDPTTKHFVQECQINMDGHAMKWKDAQADQMGVQLRILPLGNRTDQLQIGIHLHGKELQWKEYSAANCSIQGSQVFDFSQSKLPGLSFEWNAHDVRAPQGEVETLMGQFQIEDLLQDPTGSIECNMKNVHTSTMHINELHAFTNIQKTSRQWPFTLKGKGKWIEEFDFTTDGTWHYEQEQEKVEVFAQHISGRLGPYPFQILQSLHFRYQPAAMELSGLYLQWAEAKVQGEFKLDQAHVFSQFKTNAISTEILHFIHPDLPVKGHIAIEGRLEGPIEHPRGNIDVDVHDIQLIDDIFVQKPTIQGKIHLAIDNRGTTVNSQLNGIGKSPMQVSGQFPLALQINPLKIGIDDRLPFDLQLHAEGKLDPFLQLFYNGLTNASGQTAIALRFTGQMREPQIQGHIDLSEGTYESLETGALYKNIRARLEGDGSKILLKQFSAQDNKTGTIQATGSIQLDWKNRLPFEFSIHPRHIYILDSDYATIAASGSLTLTGNLEKSKLQGDLQVNEAIIRLEASLPSKCKEINIQYINIPEGEKLPTYLAKKVAGSLTELDINASTLQPLQINGNHISSEWKGSLQITGNVDNPELYGDLRIAAGEYDFNGKVFTFSQGTLHFAGVPDKKTTLYVVATKDIDRIKADIIVKGPVGRPVISFRSNPPLSQREVLSYILFNRGISSITPEEGDRLSQSFISLNSAEQPKGSGDFLSRLRNNIGLDRLDFTSDTEHQDISFQIGKHITENILLTINQGTTSLNPIIAVEAKLHKNIKAQAQAGVAEDSPVRMSIKWKKDY